MAICLHAVYGYHCAITAELSSAGRDTLATENFYFLAFYRKCLSSLDLAPIPNFLILSDGTAVLAITQLKTLCHYCFSFSALPFLSTKTFCTFPSF